MEQFLLKKFQSLISQTSDNLKTLNLARSLLTNPNTSLSTLLSITETLIQTLDLRRQDYTFARPVIKIIGDAASVHRALLPSAIQAARSFLSADDRVAADALAILDSCGEYSALDEDLVISLSSSSILSVRSRIVTILGSSSLDLVRTEVAVRVLLGLSLDLYPLVRRSAVDSLGEMLKKDGGLYNVFIVKLCYDRAVELLRDEDELVRSSVVRLVSECARLFAASGVGVGSELLDVIFVQLCWMARDMSLKVRMEALSALGKVRLVSEGVVVQSLSKKILGGQNGGSSLSEFIIKESKCPLSSTAGAFVHGIEDEFHEVRTAACKSLGMLAEFSTRFADDALNLLMDMMNDDVVAVRLQTLQTLFQMATNGHLTIQEKHLQMFLGALTDASVVIRRVARKVLQLIKLTKHEMFTSSVDALIANLVMHPEEEEDIFRVLFFVGKNHGIFTARRVKEYEKEIVPLCEGELSLDAPQAAALLMLALSVSFSDKKLICGVPPTIFSYAVPLLGKFSSSLKDVIHHDLLLVHLSNLNEMLFPARTLKSKEDEALPCEGEQGDSNSTMCTDQSCSSVLPNIYEMSEISVQRKLCDLSETSSSEQYREKQGYLNEYTIQHIRLVFKTIPEIWRLIQSQHMHKAQRMLRSCKEELEMFYLNADEPIAASLAFALCYVQVIQLLADMWEQLQPKKVICMITCDLLSESLDICLKQLRYSFSGFSRQEECHILELTLLAYVFKVCQIGSCSCFTLNKLQAVLCHLERLSEGQLELSEFYKELNKSCIKNRMNAASDPFPFQKLFQLFYLEQIPFSGKLKHIKAELLAIDNDSENPLPFVSGLPVGITFKITLYNISNKDVLWLQMVVGKSVQYAFIDVCQFEGSDATRRVTVNLPFYRTPMATSFILRACICMECQIEGIVDCRKDRGGPIYDAIVLSKEIDIYLVRLETK